MSRPGNDDHLALQYLATEYAYAVDRGEWDRLDDVFLPDARIDYTATGGIVDTYPVIKQWLPDNLKFFLGRMHFMGNFLFDVHGDTATGQIACLNPLVVRKLLTRTRHTVEFGHWYHDTYVRTSDGWRIATRRIEASHTSNVPVWMKLGIAVVSRRGRRGAG